MNETETPRTGSMRIRWNEAENSDYSYMAVENILDSHESLERELNAAIKQRDDLADEKLNNPFCAACKETDCCISGDGTCSMIRKYQSVIIEESEKLPIKNFVAEVMKQAEGGEF